MKIHENYDRLTVSEKSFVDQIFSRETFHAGEEMLGYILLGNDSVERAVEAVATWVIESRINALIEDGAA